MQKPASARHGIDFDEKIVTSKIATHDPVCNSL